MVAAFGALLHKVRVTHMSLFVVSLNSSGFIDQAIQDKRISCNFKGVALGDSWISPIG